ncbi:MAG: hypothetical protein C4316_00045 [Chloroflexota bacterium]
MAMGDYGALRERAFRFLTAAGGRASLAELARHLFGTASPDPWVGLLSRVLGPEFVIGGGEVALTCPGPAPDTPLDRLTLTVLDIETTGVDPASSRPIQVSAIGLRPNGQPAAVFQTIVRPERPLRRGLKRFTRVSELDAAPDLKTVLRELAEFVGGVVVGQDIRWQWEFLGSIARQLGVRWPHLPLLDSAVLAQYLWPDLGKPSLERLAARLGAPVLPRDRADYDAHMLAAVVPRLLAEAARRGIRSWGELEAIAGWPALGRIRLPEVRTVPEGPGVYILRDGLGRALYIGKSRNLRARVRSYFRRPPAYNRHLEGLTALTCAVEAVSCGSELSAVLLEGRLIAELDPPYNRVRRLRGPVFVYRTPEVPSRWHVGGRVPPAAPFFAAFDTRKDAAAALAEVRNTLPLPGCRRRIPARQTTGCKLAPFGDPCRVCRGELPAEGYREVLNLAEGTLAGLATSFGLILFAPGDAEVHLWVGGAYRGCLEGSALSAEKLGALFERRPDPLQTALFWRWCRLNPGAGIKIPLEYPPTGGDLQALADRLRSVLVPG